MIDKKDFAAMKKELEEFDSKREDVIQLSRTIIKLSKQAIYAIHRDEAEEAKKPIEEMKKLLNRLPKESFDTEIGKVAAQEYVEAVTFYGFITAGKLPTRKDIGVDTESYLLGICDLTGELMRRAVKAVIKGDFKLAGSITECVEGIYGQFLTLDLRNGELRKKSDQIKWNLSKLEDVMYDLKMKGKA